MKPIIWAAVVLCLCRPVGAAPAVVWYSDPVRPDETVLLYGEGFDAKMKIEVVRLADGDRGAPAAAKTDWKTAKAAQVVQAQPRSLKLVIPAALKPGLYLCRVTDAAGASVQVTLNRPKPIWAQGDGGGYATPGGMVQVVGRCVAAPGAEPTVMLTGPKPLQLAATRCGSDANEFAITAKLPKDVPLGDYQVRVHNGYGGPAGWSNPLPISVGRDPLPKTVFKVTDYGADGWDTQDDTLALLRSIEAAGSAGGGVVFFPRGNYTVSDALKIPRNVTLKGDGREATVLAWPDTENPPPAWIAGQDHFAIEDITLYCSNYRNLITADQTGDQAGSVRIERVRVRANIYNYHRTEAEVDQRFRDSLKLSTGGGDILQLGGRDVVVRDCDLYGSGRSLYLSRCRGALLSGNRFYNGRWGWYCISGSDGLIFEDNEIIGADLMSTGGGLNCLDGSMASQNIYFAHNRLRNMFGWDREAMTSDAGGGAYAGDVVAADANSVTCAADPDWGGRDWKGAAVFVLDGKGMGQYRRVAGHDGRRIEVNAPWDIIPDATSTISVTMLQRHYLLIGNSFEDAGIGIQFFGTSVDHICAGNVSARTGGFHNWGLDYYGKQPTWFVQWLDNRITDGNVFSTGGVGGVHLATFCTPPADWQHPLALGSVMRRNVLDNGARIEFGATGLGTPPDRLRLNQTAVIEHNTVRNSPVGITVLEGTPDVLLRDNKFEGVDMPIFDEKELTRRAEERRQKLTLRQEPVLRLALDEVKGKVTPDDGGMGLDGFLEGNVDMTQAGVRGRCATFDGASRIVVPRGTMLDLDNVTVSAWIKPQKVDGRFGIVAKRTASTACPFVVTVAQGALAFEATDTAGAWSFNFGSPAAIKPGEWQHIAAVHDFGKGVTLYVSGKPVATRENSLGVMGNSQPLCIGWEAWGGPSAAGENVGYYFGSIDEVTVWARPLSAEEIAQLAQ